MMTYFGTLVPVFWMDHALSDLWFDPEDVGRRIAWNVDTYQ